MHLEQINQHFNQQTVPNKIWRRISNLSHNSASKRSNLVLDELGDVKLKKVLFSSKKTIKIEHLTNFILFFFCSLTAQFEICLRHLNLKLNIPNKNLLFL